jgi:hypothetical protein
VTAAVNGLEGEARQIVRSAGAANRHLAGFSLLELLAVSVLVVREMFLSLLSPRLRFHPGGRFEICQMV